MLLQDTLTDESILFSIIFGMANMISPIAHSMWRSEMAMAMVFSMSLEPTFYTAENQSDGLSSIWYFFLAQEGDIWSRQHWPESLEWAPANAGGWVDVNDDGQLELYVINDKPHAGYRCGVLSHQDNHGCNGMNPMD